MPLLRESINSLRRQTDRDFKVLIVLDGPDDQSRDYLASVSDLDITVVEQPPLGLVHALNHLLRACTTPWLVRQDADDLSLPHRIAALRAACRRYPEAAMICSRARYLPRRRAVGCFRSSFGSPEKLRRLVQQGRLLSFCHSAVALQIPLVQQVGGYREIPLAEDADLWWRIALQHEIRCLSDVLTGFRQSEGSVSSTQHDRQQVAGLYVQYLLLSHLWGLVPQSLDSVFPSLELLQTRRHINSKKHLRSFNIELGKKNPAKAVLNLLRALGSSPLYVFGRVWDEFSPVALSNGVAPQEFWRRREVLWT